MLSDQQQFQLVGRVSDVHVHSGQPDQMRLIDFYGKEVLPRLRKQRTSSAAQGCRYTAFVGGPVDYRWKRVVSQFLITGTAVLLFPWVLKAAGNVDVPAKCTPEVNQKLSDLIAAGERRPMDNVMVCGITVSSSRTHRGGRHGSHQILPLLAPMPDGSRKLIEVVTNDDLDGKVTAPVHAQVFAYGQAFFARTGKFAAGIHDVHCATHRGADNGWVVVNGDKHPRSCLH